MNDAQIQEIRQLSAEAESFLLSSLYKKLEQMIKRSQEDIIYRLVNNVRLENEKDLTRSDFVQLLSAQYQTIPVSLYLIKSIAEQAKELDKTQEEPEVKDVRPDKGKHPTHGQ